MLPPSLLYRKNLSKRLFQGHNLAWQSRRNVYQCIKYNDTKKIHLILYYKEIFITT